MKIKGPAFRNYAARRRLTADAGSILPAGGAAGTPGEGTPASSPSGGDGSSGDGKTIDPLATGARPDWLPEKFWSPEAGEANTEGLAKAYTELERKQSQGQAGAEEAFKAEFFKGRPETPEGYEIPTAEALKIEVPEGATLEFKGDDPLMGWWRKTAHERGLDQEGFNAGIKAFMDHQLSEVPNPTEEVAKLGEKGAERVTKLTGQLTAIYGKVKGGDQMYEQLRGSMVTAGAIEALEALVAVIHGRMPDGGGDDEPAMTEEEVRKLMLTDAYRKDHDPETIAKVEKAWKRLYPEQALPKTS